jgi:hypothetical protein
MSTSDDWVLRLATIAGIVVVWMFAPAVMLTLQLPDLWGAPISCALLLGFVRLVAAVDGLPANRKRLGQLLLLAAVGVGFIVSYHLIASANKIAERSYDVGLGKDQRRRDREAERLRGFHVDHELELCRLLDGPVKVSRCSSMT